MDKRFVAGALVGLIIAAALLLMLGSRTGGNASISADNQTTGNWTDFFERKSLWQNGSVNRTLSEPQEVAPDVVFIILREHLPAPGYETTLVKISDAYVNTTNGEAVIAGYYVTTPDYEEKRWELFLRQLDPDSIDRSYGN